MVLPIKPPLYPSLLKKCTLYDRNTHLLSAVRLTDLLPYNEESRISGNCHRDNITAAETSFDKAAPPKYIGTGWVLQSYSEQLRGSCLEEANRCQLQEKVESELGHLAVFQVCSTTTISIRRTEFPRPFESSSIPKAFSCAGASCGIRPRHAVSRITLWGAHLRGSAPNGC